jgi:hypothetical protein
MNSSYKSLTLSATCEGGAIKMANLAPGTYQINVFSQPGPDGDAGYDQIYKLRAFATTSPLTLEYAKSPFSS